MERDAGLGARIDGHAVIEGVALVVATDGDGAWLDPEQGTSCGGCASAMLCGTKSGNGRRALERRFRLSNEMGLRVGERVIVGIPEGALLSGAIAAYGLPLLGLVGALVAANATRLDDGPAVLAALGGLGVGLVVGRLRAGRLNARGALSPRFLRRAGPGEACHT